MPHKNRKRPWCLWCGENLDSRDTRKKFCCIDCRRAYGADVQHEVVNVCKKCGQTMPRTRLGDCARCVSERKQRIYTSKRRRFCGAEGCNERVPWSRKTYCSDTCRNVSRKPRYSLDQLNDIMHRVALAKSFSLVAKELGIGRVSLIGILYRYGFTIERASYEAHHKAAHPESRRAAGH